MTRNKLLGLFGALALVAFAAGCGSDECSNNADCADKGATFVCQSGACVQPAANNYTVGGTVTGLNGTVVLQDNGGDDLSVTQDGAFTFATALAQGSAYAVSVKTQPDGQTCTVANGSGTLGNGNVTNVAVTCVDNTVPTFTVGGSVAGLKSGESITLQNNGGDDVTVGTDGAFTFATALADGGTYEVTVSAQPAGQTCAVANGSGTIASANVTNVTVTCTDNPTYTVGGTVTGLNGTLVLTDNGVDDTTITVDGAFTMGQALYDGTNYAVEVKTQPNAQTCVVSNGTGTIATADVTDITITCSAYCSADAECSAADASKPFCDTTNHVCVACLDNSACTAAGASVCDTTSGTCVECVDASTCTNAAAPSCDVENNTCVASCTVQTDCSISQDCVDGGAGKYCQDVNVTAASDAINIVRTTSVSSQPVVGAIVTYLKPSVSGDSAGFFVQAEATGPALFVAVDPSTLSTVPAVGDRVSFTVTASSVVTGIPTATAIDTGSWSVVSTGHSVNDLRQDVSSVDLVTNLADYDNELISLDFLVASNPSNANPGYMQAQITTAGVTTASNSLKFYAPATVFSDDDITNGCSVSLTNGVVWRFNAAAEPAVWNAADLTVNSCPAPKLLSASRTDSTTVVLTFDRNIDPLTVLPTNFAITETATPANVLAVAGTAATSPREVTLTTAPQTPGTSYTVTVSAGVKDDLGTPIDSAANTAEFNGYAPPAVLRITEINPNTSATNGGDTVELYAVTGGSLDGMKFIEGAFNSTLVSFPNGIVVSTGDIIRIHLGSSALCSETATTGVAGCGAGVAANKTQWYSDSQWDFAGSTGLAATSTFRIPEILDPSGAVEDAVPCYNPGKSDTAGITQINELQDAGIWAPATHCTDFASCAAISVDWSGTANDSTTSIQRGAITLPGDKSQWSAPAAQNFGTYTAP